MLRKAGTLPLLTLESHYYPWFPPTPLQQPSFWYLSVFSSGLCQGKQCLSLGVSQRNTRVMVYLVHRGMSGPFAALPPPPWLTCTGPRCLVWQDPSLKTRLSPSSFCWVRVPRVLVFFCSWSGPGLLFKVQQPQEGQGSITTVAQRPEAELF